MDHVSDLPRKLNMLLKAASLSRVALAQKLSVDKSLVGRWLAGTVHPTEHNLSRLSSVIADRLPGFRMADWFDSAEQVAARHGLDLASVSASGLPIPQALAEFLSATRPDLEARAGPYEGFWRTSRPSLLQPGDLFHDFGMIRRTPNGLVEVRMGGSGLDFAGYLFPFAGNIAVYLYDRIGRSPVTVMCKGVTLPRATVLDGILLLAALDPARTPAAFPLIVERVGDLVGDAEADEITYRRIVEEEPEPLEPVGEEVIRARIYRDCGPASAAAGGDAFLNVGPSSALSRGTTGKGLRG